MPENKPVNKPVVNLIGQDGHALMIISLCIKAAKKAGWSTEKIDQVKQEMISGDYDNLLQTAMKYFEVQ